MDERAVLAFPPHTLRPQGLSDGNGDDDVVRHSPALLEEHIADSASKAFD